MTLGELVMYTETILSNFLLQSVLCAIAEIVSMRFVNGIGQRTGLMGIDYPTARWLYKYVILFFPF